MQGYLFNKDRCDQMHLRESQMRAPAVCRNTWWSIDNGETFFGYGDLDMSDLAKILDWVCHPSQTDDMVFTAWHEHHKSRQQTTEYPLLRITLDHGIEHPYRVATEKWKTNPKGRWLSPIK